MNILLLASSIGGASWGLICLIISLILLFIAAFVSGIGFFRPEPTWSARGFSFAWAGVFFYVLSTALS